MLGYFAIQYGRGDHQGFHPLLYLIQRIKMPLQISQPGGLYRVLSSLGYWAPEFNWLHRLPIDWAPWAPINPLRHLVSLAPNNINICWAPEMS